MMNKHFYEAPAAACTDVALEKRFLTDSDENTSTIDDQATVTTPGTGVWGWMDKS